MARVWHTQGDDDWKKGAYSSIIGKHKSREEQDFKNTGMIQTFSSLLGDPKYKLIAKPGEEANSLRPTSFGMAQNMEMLRKDLTEQSPVVEFTSPGMNTSAGGYKLKRDKAGEIQWGEGYQSHGIHGGFQDLKGSKGKYGPAGLSTRMGVDVEALARSFPIRSSSERDMLGKAGREDLVKLNENIFGKIDLPANAPIRKKPQRELTERDLEMVKMEATGKDSRIGEGMKFEAPRWYAEGQDISPEHAWQQFESLRKDVGRPWEAGLMRDPSKDPMRISKQQQAAEGTGGPHGASAPQLGKGYVRGGSGSSIYGDTDFPVTQVKGAGTYIGKDAPPEPYKTIMAKR